MTKTPPKWVTLLLAVITIALGVWLVMHPLSAATLLGLLLGFSLILTAIIEIVDIKKRTNANGTIFRVAFAVLLILLGVVVIANPATASFMPIIVTVVFIIHGFRDIITGIISNKNYLAWYLSGASSLVFASLIFAWPDVGILGVAIVFGVWLTLTGLRIGINSLATKPVTRYTVKNNAPKKLWLAVLNFGTVLLLAGFGQNLTGAPQPDKFYAVPTGASKETLSNPGQLLRAEPFTRAMPAGSKAWRILFTTTLLDGTHSVGSGLVVIPADQEPTATIAWTHGTTGVAPGCAPTLQDDALASGAMPNVDQVIAQGWAIVATDYIGLGGPGKHAYLVGEEAAHSALDAVRAAEQLSSLRLSDAEIAEDIIIWGHSQGGASALWTGGVAQTYAPELNIRGVAAMAPAANLPEMIHSLEGRPADMLVGPLLLFGMSTAYSDVQVDDYLKPAAVPLYDQITSRCWTSKDMSADLIDVLLNHQALWQQKPLTGPLGDSIKANVPTLPITQPLLIAQGEADPLVLPKSQQDYVQKLCKNGQQVDYRTYAGKDHMGVVTGDSPLLPELMEWTKERLGGKEPKNTC